MDNLTNNANTLAEIFEATERVKTANTLKNTAMSEVAKELSALMSELVDELSKKGIKLIDIDGYDIIGFKFTNIEDNDAITVDFSLNW